MATPLRWAPPGSTATLVVRERLLGVLARRFELPLVAIEAGAGFGKTTLLAQAIEENLLRPAGRDVWLDCQPEDSSASGLLDALFHAFHALHGEAPRRSAPTVSDLCEAMWARAPEQVCLVLDDVHRIDRDSPGMAALVALVDQVPANAHLVLAGRSLAPIPLRQLVAKRQAVAVGEDDMRLDAPELALLAERHGLAADAFDGTGGWPALAELRAVTGGRGADGALLDEILASLDPDTRRQLAMTAAVGGGDRDVLAAVFGETPRMQALAAIPLVGTTPDRGLAPHALWDRAVDVELTPEVARDARRRAAGARVAAGDHRGAFELLALAGDWEAALPALFEACHEQVDPPWHDVLVRWRSLVPPGLADCPEVVYLDGLIERADDPWSPAGRRAFALAGDRYQDAGDVARELRVKVRSAYNAWMTGDVEMLDQYYARSSDMGGLAVPGLVPVIRLNRAVAADIQGDVDGGLEWLSGVPDDLEPRLRFFTPMLRGLAHLTGGDADAARADGEIAARLAADSFAAAGTQMAVLVPTVAAWMGGDVDAAAAAPLGDPGPRWSLGERVPTLAVGSVIASHLGRDDASGLLGAARRLVPVVADRDLLAGFLAVAEATALAAAGEEEAAAATIDRALAGRPLLPGTTGRALVWFAGVPALVSDHARRFLTGLAPGPARRDALEAVDALLAVREGRPPGDVALLDRPRALLTVLPPRQCVELAIGVLAGGDRRGRAVVEELRSIVPDAVRAALQALGDHPRPPVRKTSASVMGELPIPPPEDMRLEILGPARLLRGGRPVDDRHWQRERVRQLLLLVADRRAIHRAQVGDLFWPDLDERSVSSNLRTTLSYLHAVLEPHRQRGEAPYLLQQDAGVLRLVGDRHLTVDAWELEECLDRAEAAERETLASTALAHLLEALRRWRGPYLADAGGEAWAEAARHRLHARVAAAAVRATDLLVAAGRPGEAAAAAAVAIDADPWSEAAHRAAIAAHLAVGDRAAAQRAVAACEAMLGELAVGPDPSTADLFGRVRSTG